MNAATTQPPTINATIANPTQSSNVTTDATQSPIGSATTQAPTTLTELTTTQSSGATASGTFALCL